MPKIKKCKLANGQEVYCRSKTDVDLLSRELLSDDNLYLRHGLAIQDGDCIIDVGANIGFFLLYLNRVLREGKVYAFEPIPEIQEVLHRNAEQHNHLNLRLFDCGLSRQAGEATFTYFPRTSVASTMYPDSSAAFRHNSRRFVLQEMRGRSHLLRAALAVTPEWLWFPLTEAIRRYFQATQQVTCELRRLSDIIREEHIDRIDLLKVDTEGAEEDVLAGLDPPDWERIRQAVVETHHGVESAMRMERLLRDRGFKTVREPAVPGVDHLHLVFARRE